MRIDQIDIDIAGWPALSGTTRFPERGVGVWAVGNDFGKTTLVSLVTAALYGVPPLEGSVPPSGFLMVSLTLDRGERLVVARDLGTGAVQVTNSAGEDVTDRWDEAPSLGEALLGFTRAQFLDTVHFTPEAVRRTIGDDVLRAMLAQGRGRQAQPTEARSALPAATPGSAPAPTPTPVAAPESPDDLPIFHSAAEEMQWVASANFSSGDRVLSLDGGAPDDPAGRAAPDASNVAEAPANPKAPANPEVAADPPSPEASTVSLANREVRELKLALEAARKKLDGMNEEYRKSRELAVELSAERGRLGALEGAEPEDAKRLEELVSAGKKIADRKEQVRRQEKRFREDLEGRSISAQELAPLDCLFGQLSEEDLTFLDTYRQLETVLRGNQALTRSEARLDESRLQEIQRARRDAARMAIAPLVVASVGLFGSVAARSLSGIPVPPAALMAAGLLGAIAAATLLLRAKRLRTSERREIAKTLDRKRAQLTQFDREGTEAVARVSELAAAHDMADGPTLMRQHARWQAHVGELAELASFSKRAAEIDGEAVAMRERLASFTVSVVGDPSDMSDEQLDAMVNDYVRHFSVRDDLAAAEIRANELESELAGCEGAVAELSARIAAILEAEGIDSTRDLDEAIEVHALRTRDPDSAPTAGESANDGATEPTPAEGWREIDPDAIQQGSGRSITLEPDSASAESTADWSPGVSARTEAIVRRFLPDVRDLQVDADLVPQLRLMSDGPLVIGPEFAGLGSGSQDQVCLALRLAIVETLSAAGERVPIFLDDPFVRADDGRHEAAIRFLVEDACQRGQVVYLTSHEVRIRWVQHQHPELREALVAIRSADARNGVPERERAPEATVATSSPETAAPNAVPSAPAPSSSPHS